VHRYVPIKKGLKEEINEFAKLCKPEILPMRIPLQDLIFGKI
jgi:hypothetical protein